MDDERFVIDLGYLPPVPDAMPELKHVEVANSPFKVLALGLRGSHPMVIIENDDEVFAYPVPRAAKAPLAHGQSVTLSGRMPLAITKIAKSGDLIFLDATKFADNEYDVSGYTLATLCFLELTRSYRFSPGPNTIAEYAAGTSIVVKPRRSALLVSRTTDPSLSPRSYVKTTGDFACANRGCSGSFTLERGSLVFTA